MTFYFNYLETDSNTTRLVWSHWVPLRSTGPSKLLFSLVWSGLVWSGPVWSGLVWSGLVWSGLVWSGLVWSGLVSANKQIIFLFVKKQAETFLSCLSSHSNLDQSNSNV